MAHDARIRPGSAARTVATRLLLAGAALLPLAAALAACSGGSEPAGEVRVTSSDGTAVLIIPDGALPPGVSAGDITIDPIPESAVFPDGVDEIGLIAGYELRPSGLEFLAPATLVVARELPDGVPMFTLQFSTVTEVSAPAMTLLLDEDDGGFDSYQIEIAHFSQVITFGAKLLVGEQREFEVLLVEPLRPTFPGGPTLAAYQLRPSLVGSASSALVYAGTMRPLLELEWSTSTWEGNGVFSSSNLDPFTANNPANRTFGLEAPLVRQSFLCDGLGIISAELRVGFAWPVQATLMDGASVQTVEGFAKARFFTGTTSSECLESQPDPREDWIDSVSSNTPTYTGDDIDITDWSDQAISRSEAETEEVYGGEDPVYPCGLDEDGVAVVCSDAVEEMPAGDVYVFTMKLAAPLSDCKGSRSYIYSLVADSDGDPGNNWQFVPPFDWDLFRDTDRWYQLICDHMSQSWRLTATQVSPNNVTTTVPTAARALLFGDSLSFHIPRSELPGGPGAGYRMTSFGHDGAFSVSDRGADVTGPDPTFGLMPFPEPDPP